MDSFINIWVQNLDVGDIFRILAIPAKLSVNNIDVDFCDNFILNSLKKNILRNEAFGDSKASRKKIAIIYSTEEVTAKRQAFVQSYWSGMPIEDIPFIIIVGIGKQQDVKSFITLYIFH